MTLAASIAVARVAAPQKSYALIVGIEKYAVGADWNLGGVVGDARKLVEWLLLRGVPRDQILLFLSPLDAVALENDPLPVAVAAADSTNILKAITETIPKWTDGQFLFLFWIGHGVAEVDFTRRLYYADATANNRINLNLESFLAALRTHQVTGFQFQIAVVDACGSYAECEDWTSTLPNHELPRKHLAVGREQYVIFSARPGETAPNRRAQDPSSFLAVVLKALGETPPNRWPPDMDVVWKAVEDAFRKQSSRTGQDISAGQHPVLFKMNWQGDRHVEGESVKHRQSPSHQFAPEDVPFVASRLSAMPCLADPAKRAAVLRELSFDCSQGRTVGEDFFTHLARVALAAPGGLESLTESVFAFDENGEQMVALFEAVQEVRPQPIMWGETGHLKNALALVSATAPVLVDLISRHAAVFPPAVQQRRPSALVAIDHLARIPLVFPEQVPLLELAERVRNANVPAVVKQQLAHWLDAVAARLGFDLAQLREAIVARDGATTTTKSILIKIESDPATPDQFRMRAWLAQWPSGSRDITPEHDKQPLTKLLGLLPHLLRECRRYLGGSTSGVTMEILLPISAISVAVDAYPIPVGIDETRPVGTHIPIVVRSLERTYWQDMDIARGYWRERWQRRPLVGQLAGEAVIWIPDQVAFGPGMYDNLKHAGAVCAATALRSNGSPTSAERDTLRHIVNSGTPIGLWLRRTPADMPAAVLQIAAMATGDPLAELADRVLSARETAYASADEAHPSRHITVLWDDPERPPPDYDVQYSEPE